MPDGARLQLRALVVRAFTECLPPRRLVAEMIPWLPLPLADQSALQIYRVELIDKGYTGERFDKAWQRYRPKLLRTRAEFMAQREVHRASNEGLLLNWRETLKQGFLDAARTWRTWIATPGDDRTCELCLAMHQQRVRWQEPFQTALGPRWTPPLYETCRCGMGLQFDLSEEHPRPRGGHRG